jgi:HAMP domain-containing protein
VLYRLPDSTRASAVPGEGPSEAVAPAEDPVRFTVPIILHPVALTAAPAPRARAPSTGSSRRGTVRRGRPSSVATASGLGFGAGPADFRGRVGLAHGIGRRLSGAIRRIAAAIQRIQNGDLTPRLPRTDQNELGTLQEGVNLLADTLARGRRASTRSWLRCAGSTSTPWMPSRSSRAPPNRPTKRKACSWPRSRTKCAPPCTRFRAWVELLLKAARADSRGADPAYDPRRRLETLYRHISDILDVTQLEKGKYAPVHGSAGGAGRAGCPRRAPGAAAASSVGSTWM